VAQPPHAAARLPDAHLPPQAVPLDREPDLLASVESAGPLGRQADQDQGDLAAVQAQDVEAVLRLHGEVALVLIGLPTERAGTLDGAGLARAVATLWPTIHLVVGGCVPRARRRPGGRARGRGAPPAAAGARPGAGPTRRTASTSCACTAARSPWS
jgi:hypothetical protein